MLLLSSLFSIIAIRGGKKRACAAGPGVKDRELNSNDMYAQIFYQEHVVLAALSNFVTENFLIKPVVVELQKLIILLLAIHTRAALSEPRQVLARGKVSRSRSARALRSVGAVSEPILATCFPQISPLTTRTFPS